MPGLDALAAYLHLCQVQWARLSSKAGQGRINLINLDRLHSFASLKMTMSSESVAPPATRRWSKQPYTRYSEQIRRVKETGINSEKEIGVSEQRKTWTQRQVHGQQTIRELTWFESLATNVNYQSRKVRKLPQKAVEHASESLTGPTFFRPSIRVHVNQTLPTDVTALELLRYRQ